MNLEIGEADLGEELFAAWGGGGEDNASGAEFVQDGEFEGEGDTERWGWGWF